MLNNHFSNFHQNSKYTTPPHPQPPDILPFGCTPQELRIFQNALTARHRKREGGFVHISKILGGANHA